MVSCGTVVFNWDWVCSLMPHRSLDRAWKYFGCYRKRCHWHLVEEAGEAANHPTVTAPPRPQTKNYQAQNVHSVEAEKPCFLLCTKQARIAVFQNREAPQGNMCVWQHTASASWTGWSVIAPEASQWLGPEQGMDCWVSTATHGLAAACSPESTRMSKIRGTVALSLVTFPPCKADFTAEEGAKHSPSTSSCSFSCVAWIYFVWLYFSPSAPAKVSSAQPQPKTFTSREIDAISTDL